MPGFPPERAIQFDETEYPRTIVMRRPDADELRRIQKAAEIADATVYFDDTDEEDGALHVIFPHRASAFDFSRIMNMRKRLLIW